MSGDPVVRLAFLLPGSEAWLKLLVTDLLSVAECVGLECLFLCEGEASRELGGTWIELDRLEDITQLRRLAASYQAPEVAASELERELRYCRARFGEKFTPEDVKSRYQNWMNQARALFRLIQPDQVWVWNGTLYRAAAFASVAQNMDISLRFCEKGAMPGSWALDPRGTNGDSSLLGLAEPPVEEGSVRAMRDLVGKWDGGGQSAWEQPGRLRRQEQNRIIQWAGGRKIVFFPGQVDSDSNIICFSPHFQDSREALRFLVDNLGEEYVFLVKPHPKGSVGAQEYQQVVQDRGRVIENINVLDAVNSSDLVVTINSTVGFEAALRGKPVFSLGRGILSGRSFVREWAPEKPLADQVRHWLDVFAHGQEEIGRQALAWAAYLHDEYYLFLDDREGLRKCLKRQIGDLRKLDGAFSRLQTAEVAFFLSPHSIQARTEGIQGRDLLRTAWHRLLQRLRILFKGNWKS